MRIAGDIGVEGRERSKNGARADPGEMRTRGKAQDRPGNKAMSDKVSD